jgi:hypothetical protein
MLSVISKSKRDHQDITSRTDLHTKVVAFVKENINPVGSLQSPTANCLDDDRLFRFQWHSQLLLDWC